MAKASAKMGKNDVQVPLWHVLQGDWTPPDISSLPPWPTKGRVSIDFETRDDHIKSLGPGVRRGAYIIGYSFAIEDGPAHYIPLRHAGGDNVSNPAAALQYLRDQAKRFRGPGTTLVGANLPYDLDFAEEAGIEFRPEWFRDIQVADPLIWELHESYSLDAIAKRRGFDGKDEAELQQAARDWGVDPKQELWKLPGRYAYKYGVADVLLPLQILRKQEREIEDQELQAIFDLESRLLPVLLRMRRRGVLIDQPHLQRVEDFAIRECAVSLAEVKAHTRRSLVMDDVMKPAAVAPVLEMIGVRLDTTTLGKPSIDKDLLDKLDHPVAKALARARRLYKLRNTFVASIREHMTNGRIHCTFNQLRGSSAQDSDIKEAEDEKGARYGRLSSCDPNLQQQPARDPEFAKLWRSIYIPEPGMLWAACDFSQQEPRVLTHYAELCGCRKAREFGDKYRTDPKADTYDGLSAMTRTKRTQTKIIYLGLSYSMGGAKLCKSLKLPTVWRPGRDGKLREFAGPEGEALFKAFHEGAPFIRELNYKIQDAIQERGYIRTLLGRKIHFPPKAVPTANPVTGKMEPYDWAHKGLNRLIQGSSADQTKKAVVDLDDAGHFIQLQVHDEVDGSVRDAEEGQQMGEIMRNAVKLTVPMRVDVEIGPSWGGSMG
jgi:DNA polymerase I-like protein with 3'-5' exonuclease and polymerase domains